MAGILTDDQLDQARAYATSSRLEQGLPARVGPEHPDELARVIDVVRQGFSATCPDCGQPVLGHTPERTCTRQETALVERAS